MSATGVIATRMPAPYPPLINAEKPLFPAASPHIWRAEADETENYTYAIAL